MGDITSSLITGISGRNWFVFSFLPAVGPLLLSFCPIITLIGATNIKTCLSSFDSQFGLVVIALFLSLCFLLRRTITILPVNHRLSEIVSLHGRLSHNLNSEIAAIAKEKYNVDIKDSALFRSFFSASKDDREILCALDRSLSFWSELIESAVFSFSISISMLAAIGVLSLLSQQTNKYLLSGSFEVPVYLAALLLAVLFFRSLNKSKTAFLLKIDVFTLKRSCLISVLLFLLFLSILSGPLSQERAVKEDTLVMGKLILIAAPFVLCLMIKNASKHLEEQNQLYQDFLTAIVATCWRNY